MTPEMLLAIEQAVERAFSSGVDDKRFIDVTRIPLICQSILGIHEDLKEIKETINTKFVSTEQFWPIKTLVYGFVILILVAVVGALVMSVIPHATITLP